MQKQVVQVCALVLLAIAASVVMAEAKRRPKCEMVKDYETYGFHCEGSYCKQCNLECQTCKMIGGRPQCLDTFDCLDEYEPVCGSDGKTYDNECILRETKCGIRSGGDAKLRVKHMGECSDEPEKKKEKKTTQKPKNTKKDEEEEEVNNDD